MAFLKLKFFFQKWKMKKMKEDKMKKKHNQHINTYVQNVH